MLENFEEVAPELEESETEQNRVLLWGVFGIVFGVIVAASVMFRTFETRVFSDVPPPFREEE